jgi:hypothetical protein
MVQYPVTRASHEGMLRLALRPLMARENSKQLEANRKQRDGRPHMMHDTRILKSRNQISEFEFEKKTIHRHEADRIRHLRSCTATTAA